MPVVPSISLVTEDGPRTRLDTLGVRVFIHPRTARFNDYFWPPRPFLAWNRGGTSNLCLGILVGCPLYCWRLRMLVGGKSCEERGGRIYRGSPNWHGGCLFAHQCCVVFCNRRWSALFMMMSERQSGVAIAIAIGFLVFCLALIAGIEFVAAGAEETQVLGVGRGAVHFCDLFAIGLHAAGRIRPVGLAG